MAVVPLRHEHSPGDRTIVDAEVAHPMQADTRYTYNPAGAITSIADSPVDQPADTRCFRYDYLQRLTEAWTPATEPCSTDPATIGLGGPARYWQFFTYDKSGNRTADTQHYATGDITRRNTYAVGSRLWPIEWTQARLLARTHVA